ncbi:MAG: hypothetical protein ACI8U4_003226 [Natronomonas sp.]|jgi:hypothetical protein
MLPLHSGHPGSESILIVALALVVVAAAIALTRDGWSRVGALAGVALLSAGTRGLIETVGFGGAEWVHLGAHGLELGAIALTALTVYYALFDARTATTVDT